MLFNSFEFALFFPLVFLLYWIVFNRNTQLRNLFILVVSYFFYAAWDWRFLSLIFISSVSDFLLGNKIDQATSKIKKKYLLYTSILINIGILGFFKYYNFFIDSFITTFSLFGMEFSHSRLVIILPVGISFYTFQTLSYTLDIYHQRFKAYKDPIGFFAFVSFFPQLIAGPIERAKDLLPQFTEIHQAHYLTIKNGLLLLGFGLFQKIVIADRLAVYVDLVFTNIPAADGLPMLLGLLFFAFQLYIDFSAYSNIAIGLAATLGFNLSINFNRPYLSTSFAIFWSRWHISLSSWFRDYLYIPLGGNRLGINKKIRNILVVFTLSGLWHGASWNFIIWGGLNAFFLLLLDPLMHKLNLGKITKVLLVGVLWMFSLAFFRAQTYVDALLVFKHLGWGNQNQIFQFGLNNFQFKLALYLLFLLMLIEVLNERKVYLLVYLSKRPFMLRYTFYVLLILSVLFFGAYGLSVNDHNFIYFQF